MPPRAPHPDAPSQLGSVTLELLVVGAFCMTLVWFGLEGTRLANTFSELDKSMRAAARYAATTEAYTLATAQDIVRYGKPLGQGESGREVVAGAAAASIAVCFISPGTSCSNTPTSTSTSVEVTVSNLKFTPATPLSSLNSQVTLRSISVRLPTLP
ncbi:MAG: hypothetical protein IIA02_13505 [Proteobacteria bacterium]|uniref:hypothetical protein n=1 Tax=Aquabacterium sp. TaxID=1872578 RepID=UPI0035C73236|nr:hypothetical protein [Pseudomonadota bacterium]